MMIKQNVSDFMKRFPHKHEWHLDVLEKVNPCQQSYYVKESSYFIEYKIELNIFNFSKGLKLKIPANVVGYPFSVCQQGFNKPLPDLRQMFTGLTVVLNADERLDKNCGKTLSTYVFNNDYDDFYGYLADLRSHYRYRVKKALKKREFMTIRNIEPKDFTMAMYQLYEEVYDHSNDQLEKLSIAFFKAYPSVYHVFEDHDGRTLAFIQTVQHEDQMWFLFGGFNRAENLKYDLYYNMLLQIIEIGILKKSKHINMGQTADETKLKVGCVEKTKYMYCYHSNKVLNKLIHYLLPYFSFKPYPIKHHVFRRGINEDTPI